MFNLHTTIARKNIFDTSWKVLSNVIYNTLASVKSAYVIKSLAIWLYF